MTLVPALEELTVFGGVTDSKTTTTDCTSVAETEKGGTEYKEARKQTGAAAEKSGEASWRRCGSSWVLKDEEEFAR